MATKNDITGDALISKTSNANYLNNYDLIFRKKKDAEQTDQQAEEALAQDQDAALRSMRKSCA